MTESNSIRSLVNTSVVMEEQYFVTIHSIEMTFIVKIWQNKEANA